MTYLKDIEQATYKVDSAPKHTPGPWELRTDRSEYRIYARGQNVSGVVARINTDWPFPEQQAEQRANASHIVKCVNAHDELVEALERSEYRLESIIEFLERHCAGENATAKRNIALSIQAELSAALAKARGAA